MRTRPERARASRRTWTGGITLAETTAAALLIAGWLMLFSGGILIDTKPYRYAISPEGVWAMDGVTDPEQRYEPETVPESLAESWAMVLVFYLPVNLALICVIAGALGAVGSRANLQGENEKRWSTDRTSPYASAMLRGFFIYLFLTSGILLLDDNPFDHPSPGQYIRLAGFLSLMSFVVNYRPDVFSRLLTLAYNGIEARGLRPPAQGTTSSRTEVRQTSIVHDHLDRFGPAPIPEDSREAVANPERRP